MVIVIAIVISIPMWLETDQGPFLSPPDANYWLGTDAVGRSVLSRTILGIINSFADAILVMIGSLAVGGILGILSVLRIGRDFDTALIMTTEAIRAFPTIILVLLLATAGVPNVILLIIFFWTSIWRLVRNLVSIQQSQPYAISAQIFGMPKFLVLLFEVLPNVWPEIRNYLPALLAEIISVLTALEFLGFGVNLDSASLGRLLAEALSLGFAAPWVWFPGLILLVSIIMTLVYLNHRVTDRQRWVPLG